MPEEIKSERLSAFSPGGPTGEPEEVAIAEEIIFNPGDAVLTPDERMARSQAHEELAMLRAEIRNLRDRLTAISRQTATVIKAERNFIDASAHAQLGNYPWAKLAGASVAAFMVGKALRTLPFGLIAATLLNTAAANRR